MKTKETNPTRPGSPTPCKKALKVDSHCRVIYVRTHVNEIETTYEVLRTDVRVERVSTLTFTRDSSHITSFVFTHINFTRVRT